MHISFMVLIALVILGLTMAVAWLVVMRSGNGGWSDTFWTLGVGGAAVTVCLIGAEDGSGSRQNLVAALALIWAVRLAGYLVSRTYRAPEDARYHDLRRAWGDRYPTRLLGFLQVQALAGVPLVTSIGLAAHRPGDGPDLSDLAGALVFAVGVLGGALADWQMARFKSNPSSRGRVCDVGLWRISRHPNYLFEWIGWWAWPLIALDLSGHYGVGGLALMAPLTMYVLLVHVSGVPPLEAHLMRSRPEAFRAYRARTPKFFPRLAGLRAQRRNDIGDLP